MEAERDKRRDDWERTRMLATLLLQPYSKKPLKPENVMLFTWDNETPDNDTFEAPQLTKEQHAARAAQLMANNG